MKKNTFLYVLRLALTLLIITATMAAALAVVNQLTAPVIAQSNEAKVQAAIEKVLPGGGKEMEFSEETGLVTKVWGSEMGYAVQVEPSGFDGAITMMVGIGKDGKVLGISIISHTETAGLGAVAAAENAKGQAFRNQFVGMSGQMAVTKDGGDMDAITGATVTSRAVCKGVNAALACVEKLREVQP